MMTMSSPASATVVMRVRKVMMRVLTHGMVTNVATQSRPAMMRRVRDRFGRVEKGWMIVRYLKIFCRVQSSISIFIEVTRKFNFESLI